MDNGSSPGLMAETSRELRSSKAAVDVVMGPEPDVAIDAQADSTERVHVVIGGSGGTFKTPCQASSAAWSLPLMPDLHG